MQVSINGGNQDQLGFIDSSEAELLAIYKAQA
jgi:hypothetical protein